MCLFPAPHINLISNLGGLSSLIKLSNTEYHLVAKRVFACMEVMSRHGKFPWPIVILLPLYLFSWLPSSQFYYHQISSSQLSFFFMNITCLFFCWQLLFRWSWYKKELFQLLWDNFHFPAVPQSDWIVCLYWTVCAMMGQPWWKC